MRPSLLAGCVAAATPWPCVLRRAGAYPQMKSTPSTGELADVYTPNFVELVWAENRTKESAPRVGLLVLLKTFQRLGYFVTLPAIPRPILEHVAHCPGYGSIPEDLFRYGASSARRRHMLLIRDYTGVKVWGGEAQQAMERASNDAARTLEDLPDIINVLLEQLIRQRFELPAFSVLHRTAQHTRAMANRKYHTLICDRLDTAVRERLTIMLTRVEDETKSPWHRLKGEPKQPTAQNNREFLDHLAWLKNQAVVPGIFREIPDVKLKQFAAEARSLQGKITAKLTTTERKYLLRASTKIHRSASELLSESISL
jgi:hypothetical protein